MTQESNEIMAASPGRKGVLVLGMHRSGTSAMTGVLGLAGVDLGERLVPGAADNEKGFFEHEEVWRIHEDLLNDLGSSWHDIRPLPQGWVESEHARRAETRLRAIVEEEFSASALWGIKDPRLSRTLPLWPALLAELGVENPAIVLCLRHPLEVARSLMKRDGLLAGHALALWLRYTLEAEWNTRGLRRVVQHYPELLSDWRGALEHMDSVLGLGLMPLDEARKERIEAFLDGGMRHHHAGSDQWPQELVGSAWVAWAQEAYDAMLLLEEKPDVARDRLDGIRRSFEQVLAEAFPLAEQIGDHRRQLRDQELDLAWFKSEREKHEAEIQRLKAAVEQARLQRERLERDRQRLEAETQRLQQELNTVYASRSWQITRPLRALSAFLRPVDGEREPRVTEETAQVEERAAPRIKENTPTQNPVPRTEVSGVRPVNQRAGEPPLRLLIVTPDIHGPIRNGGIGTAFFALARAAVAEGLAVTICYALGDHSEDGPIDRWVKYYADQGIDFQPLNTRAGRDQPMVDAPWYRQAPWRVHRWLQQHQQEFDLVVFPEWMGLAYYVLLAKRQGLDYESLPIIVNTHSPEAWAMEGNMRLPEWIDDVDRDFMERSSVAWADVVISPSAYLLRWMQQHGWTLPEDCRVLPNAMELPAGVQARRALTPGAVRVVFFGRLEPRKGLKLFCDAVDRLSLEAQSQISEIVFLGKAVVYSGGFDSRSFLAERTAKWKRPVAMLTDRNREQAMRELQQPNTLVVIPSLVENSPYTVLECLALGIPFLAAEVGGIPEMLAEPSRERHLFRPTPASLAATLAAAVTEGLPAAEPAWEIEQAGRKWVDALREIGSAKPAEQVDVDREPFISVCLVHYDRPRILQQALESLYAQTYANFEVVLVDDGSPSVEAQQYLDELEQEFASRGWRILRQENAYLGAARNNAARAARGEYLLFMDDDNIALPHMLETFARAAIHGGADVLTCVIQSFTGDVPPARVERIWLPLGGALGPGLYRNAFGDANALWKKAAFDRIGGYTTDHGVGHEDWELFADAVLSGLRLELVPEPLYWYRVNPSGMLRSGSIWADHARSVRPYLKHDPQGLGMALAHGLYLELRQQQQQPVAPMKSNSIWRLLRLARDPALRAQFLGVWRNQGLKIALRRARTKVVR